MAFWTNGTVLWLDCGSDHTMVSVKSHKSVCLKESILLCGNYISREKKQEKKSLPPNCFPFPSLWRQSSLISLSGQDEQQAETCIEIVLCLETSLVWRPLLTHKNRKDAQMLFIGFDEAKAYLSRGETKLSFSPSWCISSCMGAGRGPKETEQSRGCPWDLEFLVCLFLSLISQKGEE